ncbi:DUF4347 domain-containing protein [Microcoleus sp. FACHB-672]|uniref:DUF4347 domain-containing protein n=1 Tax=Microcoleus sp. FACHB-672 TaxID=2692825 RepID=UPI001689AB6B|nr:DUF4347 domain-containing protein [Microcoleus sp. FACHB-672]MBD2039834.1 DUF4347 domain-containing protein [Microcoleus sp. FACHB-672]
MTVNRLEKLYTRTNTAMTSTANLTMTTALQPTQNVPAQQNISLVIIDSAVENWDTLRAGVVPGTEVVVLAPDQDGIAQISEVLRQYRGQVTTVHIVSHGTPGCLYLGNAQLSLHTLSYYTEELQQWFVPTASVSPRLFIYGCQVAAGDAGIEFLSKLQALTGANIAASANLTGTPALGGDWNLELTLGESSFTSAFTPELMENYAFILADIASNSELKNYLTTNKISTEAQLVLTDIFTAFDKTEAAPNTTKTATAELADGTLQVTYLGSNLSLNALVPDVAGFELKDFAELAKLNLPAIPISGQPSLIIKNPTDPVTAEYELSVKDFSIAEFLNQATTSAGVSLDPDLKKNLESLGKFDLSLSENKISIQTSEDEEINLADFITNDSVKGFLGKLEPQLILSDLAFSYEVDENNKTSVSISGKMGQGDTQFEASIEFSANDYKISVKDFPVGNFITSIANAAGVTLASDIETSLKNLGKFDLSVSENEVSIASSGQITIDLQTIASINTPADAIDTAINDALKSIFGDTKLTFAEPKFGYSVGEDGKQELALSAKIGGGENPASVSLEFGSPSDVKLEYEVAENLSLASLLGLDELKGLEFEDLKFIAANYNDDSKDEQFIKGFNFSGKFDFQDGDDIISKLFRDDLKITQLDAKLQIGDKLNLEADAQTNWNLIDDGEFKATLSQIGLGLKLDGTSAKFGIDGTLKLIGYDSTQTNEPELALLGELALETNSLNAAFALSTDSNQGWTNPFGFKGTEIRNFGITAGIGATGLDNFGVRGDLKYGAIDIAAAFKVDFTDPDKTAVVLTLNQPVSLVGLITGPVSPFIFGEGASDNALTDAFELLDNVIDVQADSLTDEEDEDKDGDKQEKLPFIKFVPVEGIEIAGETLESGFGINAKVKAWDSEARLKIGADEKLEKFEGSLALKNIDLGFLKIAGADQNDDELNLNIVVDTTPNGSSYLEGDGRVDIFGFTVAKADFKVSETGFNIKDLDLNLFDVVAFDIDDLNINVDANNPENSSASGAAKLKVLGQELANASFSVDKNQFSINGGVGVSVLGYDIGVDVGLSLGENQNEIRFTANFGGEKFSTEYNLSELSSSISSISGWVSDWLYEQLSSVVNDVKDAVVEVFEEVTDWFGGFFNGPLAGATVFIDENGNFLLDAGELRTTSDNNGKYQFDEAEIATLDVDQDGKIDIQNPQIVSTGGIDTTTGLPATLPLISQISDTAKPTIATPLTTLKAVLFSQGITAEEVETLLKKISGLPLASLSQPLDKFDPYAAIGKDDSSAIDIASGHIKVMNLLLNTTSFLKAAQYEGTDSQVQVIVALGAVLQQVNAFDLSKSADVQQLLTQLSQKLNLSVTGEVTNAVAELVAQSNNLVDELVEQALGRSVSTVLPSINPIKKAVYSTLPAVTQQLVAGEITAQQSQTQLQELLNADTFLVQYALNEKRTVKVTSSPTLTEGDKNSQGQFVITLGEAAPSQGLKILYTLAGTATQGQDYSSKGGQFGEINIAPGATKGIIDLAVLDDTFSEMPESITLNLKYVGDGFALDPVYKTAVLQITDNDESSSANRQNGVQKTGTFGNDSLIGEAGDDNLSGSYGNDVLQGLAGNDQLIGGAGNDSLLGGEGSDTLEGNFGADALKGNAGNDVIAGGGDNDNLEGNEGNDQLHGNAGHDLVQGNDGNDLLEGGFGNDVLKGNKENDWLIGEAGQDILIGGEGIDLLNGGAGADVFYFSSPSQGGDLILDFDPTQGDKIQVFGTGFNTNSLADFSVLAGTLYFKEQELALIQNNGQTYNHFANLADIVEIVSEPTAQQAKATAEISTQVTPSAANPELVRNPETTILDDIIKRGQIKVSTNSPGANFDSEFARTLAAALFGDANKVEQIETPFTEAFTQVADGTVDLGYPRATHNLGGDATLNIDFSPLYFYDHQGVIVRKNSGIENVLGLKGRTIGVLEGSTSLSNLEHELKPQGVEFTSKSFATIEEAIAAYDRGEIDAFSIDSALIIENLSQLSNPDNHRLLDVEFSKEPIALALPENDSQWADVVRWVNYVPVQAEEFGINSQNIDELIAANTDENLNNDSSESIRRFLGIEDELGASLGLPNDFAVNVIKQVGNYGEIYERHFSGEDRDRNLLSTDGGLLYSPPFSGKPIEGTLVNNDNRNLLAEVLQRGVLKLGVPGNNPGFAVQQANGEFVGFDVDLGRAIAAGLFGDATKIDFQTQSLKDSFANTANGVVDVSAMGITQNLVRDASLGVDFSPTYLYTGQGILVRSNSGINVLPALNGRRIGVLEGATSLQNIQDSLSEFGATFIPVKFGTNDELFAAYDRGELDAVSTDLTILSARIPTLSNPEQHQILDEVISKEPLALITDENQSEWADVVRWVYNALVQAEEYGITSANIEEFITKNTDDNPANDSNSAIRQFLGIEGNIGEAIGLPKDFAVNVIKAVGNYGEMYERHFNSNVLRRDNNALADEFGLQYALPFTGASAQQTPTTDNTDTDDLDSVSGSEEGTFGTDGNDSLIGDRENNIIRGLQGNDYQAGNKGDDYLDGGEGEDSLYGGKGNDILKGSSGHDSLFGHKGNDSLDAGEGNDKLYGKKGNDYLNSGEGDDIVYAGKGNDILLGGNGDDSLVGHNGDDNLDGGAGNDILTGDNNSDDEGALRGVDRFVLQLNAGSDTITDFTNGQDLIVLAGGITFNQLTISAGSEATLIYAQNELLATLKGVDSTLINQQDFVTI